MFFSLSVSWGGLIMFGSYNKFRHRVHYPALIISSLDFLTSIIGKYVLQKHLYRVYYFCIYQNNNYFWFNNCHNFAASVVVFSVLGHLKVKGGYEDIQDVVKQKQGLAFVAYPEALNLLYLPQLWSVIFFFMLFLLGLDSQFALLETVLTGVYDMFPKTRSHKVVVCLLVCCACYLLR